MAEKLQYELTLSNRATGTGARDTAAGLDKVAASTGKASDASARFLSAAEREVAEVERLVLASQRLSQEKARLGSANQSLETFLRRTNNEAKVSEVAFYNLDVAANKTKNTSEELADTTKKVATQTTNSGRSFQNTAYQLQDISVQIAGGIAPMRAIGQQLPQILQGFGLWGTLLGAAVPILAVFLEKLNSIGGISDDVRQRLDFTAEAARQIGESLAQEKIDKINEGNTAIQNAITAELNLKTRVNETDQAAKDAATSNIERSQQFIQAGNNLLEILGKQVDRYREINALSGLKVQGLEEKAGQSVSDEEKAVANAKANQEAAEKTLQIKYNERAADEARLAKEREALGVFTRQKQELEEQLKLKKGILNALILPFTLPFVNEDEQMKAYQPGAQDKAREAELKLKDPSFNAGLADSQKSVTALEAKLDKNSEFNKSLDEAAAKLEEQNRTLADKQSTAAINIQQIQKGLEEAKLEEKVTVLQKTQEQVKTDAGKIQEAIEGFMPVQEKQQSLYQKLQEGLDTTGQTQQAAKDAILKALSDGKVTADESRAIGTNLNTLLSTLKEGQSGQGEILKQLIELNTSLFNNQVQFENLIQGQKMGVADLKKRLDDLQNQPR